MLPSVDCCDVIYGVSCVALTAILVAALRHTFRLVCDSSSGGVVVCESAQGDHQVSPASSRMAAMTSLFRNFASVVCSLETSDGESGKRYAAGMATTSSGCCVE